MVYEWDDKQETCYRLYVEERRSLDEVMRYMKEVHDFDPSKRAYQTQFRRWNFPSKHHPAHRNQALVARVHQLWEANTSQKDMLRTLVKEGFEIKERELMRVRAKNRWLLRVPNGTKSFGPTVDVDDRDQQPSKQTPKKRKRGAGSDNTTPWTGDVNNAVEEAKEDGDDDDEDDDEEMKALEQSILDESATLNPDDAERPSTEHAKRRSPSPEELSPEVLEKRRQRLAKLEAESAELWATKKRRRRTRGWAGLPADPPGPPRFPSETTIDESKAFLHMNNETYRDMRDQFQNICDDAGFIKKTIAGPEKWQAAKDRLIAENAHLNREFFGPFNGVPNESKSLALDVVCTDVTKRMRTMERRMTIAEAKNVLHINPEQSRKVRNEYYEILKSDHFTSKIQAGDEHWKELKQQWIANSAILTDILKQGEADSKHSQKHKAIEILARDVMKRLRDDQTKRDPSRKKQTNFGPGPGPAPPRVAPATTSRSPPSTFAPTASMMPVSQTPSSKRGFGIDRSSHLSNEAMQIDPSLLAAAADPSLAEQLQRYAASAEGASTDPTGELAGHASYTNGLASTAAAAAPAPSPSSSAAPAAAAGSAPASVAVLFRLSPLSAVQTGPKVWLGTLHSGAVAELRQRATQGRAGCSLLKAEGVLTDQHGHETLFSIDRDDELEAYLQYVVGGKVQFVVQLGEDEFAV